jgi:hypothetical protein
VGPIQLFHSPAWLVGIVAVGAALRVWQYAGNPSLELDELALARNIVGRPTWDLLFKPLHFAQVAPQGFLLSEKGMVLLLGHTEYALRLWPLLCSVGALVLFWRIAVGVLQGVAVPFAVGLFALKPAFILYGATAKQYASDIAAVLLLTLLALKLGVRSSSWPRCLLMGALGALVAQWSHAAALALFGLGGALALLAWVKRDMRGLGALSMTLALWAVGAAATVVLGVQRMTPATRAYMHSYWQDGFLPWHSSAQTIAVWLWHRFYDIFDLESLHSAWYEWPGLYVGLAALGTWSLWQRRRDACLLLLAPVVTTLTASVVHQYPFKGRPVMFLAPLFLLLAAAGAERLCRPWSSGRSVVGAVGLLLLAVPPLYGFMTHLPVYRREEVKPLMAHVQKQRLPGDAIYVYYGAWQAMAFYAPRYGFRDGEYVVGGCHRGNPRAYLRELDRFRGHPRLWILAAHAMPSLQELPVIIAYLDRIGRRRESVRIPARMWSTTSDLHDIADAQVYLYDLSDEARLALISAETFPLPRAFPMRPPPGLDCTAGPQVPVANAVSP